jgi:hypothetical protein
MYKNNFAAAIRVNGKILREFGDTVYLPFGSEYQIRLKNLNTTRAKVSVKIDGENVTGGGLVLNSYQTIDLERFIRNGNLTEGNRFKFIERTSKIEQHRGIQVEDGIISIHFEFEMPAPVFNTDILYRSFSGERISKCSLPTGPVGHKGPMGVAGEGPLMNYSVSSVTHDSCPVNDTGITVEGSKSNQSFTTTYWGGTIGSENVMNIRLLGETEENKMIREPVTVKTKLECKTCGTINPTTSKFCSECGTSLQII